MDGRRRGPIHLPPEGMRGRRTSPILIVLALFVSAWILYQRPAALWRPRTFDEDPLTPIRLPDMHVQRVTLKADEDHLRVKVDAPGLDGTSGWKARTWVRVKPTWIESQLFHHLADHPKLASSLILLKSPDWSTTVAIYPVGTLAANNDLVVVSDSHGVTIQANARRVIPGKEEDVFVVVAKATNPTDERNLVGRVVSKARELVGGKEWSKEVPEFWDGLGICTWESLRSDGSRRPSHDNLLELVPDFPLKHFLIDDGWQDVSEARGLVSFNPWAGFGGDMASVVSALKAKNVEEVGVWLTLQGYWISIEEHSPLIEKYDCQKHHTAEYGQPRGGVIIPLPARREYQWLPSPEKAAQFWMDYFTHLKSWGIAFVKVDNQAHFDIITSPTAAHVQQAMWSGMLAAVEKVWGSTDRVIMCMSHNERMFNGPGGLGVDRPSGNLVFRNSDDYNADYPQGHQDFIVWNAYSSVLTTHLALVPDFDMFASNDKMPLYHALLRVLSPGPTLLSETPKYPTDKDLLAKMTSTDQSGRTKVVKTDTPAAALSGRWFWDNVQGSGSGPALMASVPVPAVYGALLGVWNVRDPKKHGKVIDHISLQDVRDALGVDKLDGEYIAYRWSHFGDAGPQAQVFSEGQDEKMPINLDVGEADMITIAKVWEEPNMKYAMVGMADKLAPLAGMSAERQKDGKVWFSTRYHSKGIRIVGFPPDQHLSASVHGLQQAAVAQTSISPNMTVYDIPLKSGGTHSAAAANEGVVYRFSVHT